MHILSSSRFGTEHQEEALPVVPLQDDLNARFEAEALTNVYRRDYRRACSHRDPYVASPHSLSAGGHRA